ncbi:MAG: response regulator [Spirochaetales bacterium]|nr:response regulator [Spirochaetales bacterium]
MQNTPHLDVLVVDDTPSRFPEVKELFDGVPDITVFFATSLAEAIHILVKNNIGCAVTLSADGRANGYMWHRVLKDITPALPILLYPSSRNPFLGLRRRRLEREGIRSLRPGRRAPQTLPEAVFETARSAADTSAAEGFRGEILFSPLHAEEKYALLQTALDILSHDTKDIFIRILSILSDIPQNEYSGILNDYVNELFEYTSEALGFITAQKRVESLIDLVNAVKISSEKIPLPSHSRIELAYDPRKLLFIETSRLLKHALGNLIDNALKYSPVEEKVKITLTRRGNDVLFTVADRGIGIPPTERELVFGRDYRAANTAAFAGTGKGLWIAANIVREEQGRISVEENQGGGSIVTVCLRAFSLRTSDRRLTDLSEWFKLPREVVEKKARIMKTILLLEFPAYEREADSLTFANLLDHFRDERRKKERQKYFYKLQEYMRYNPNGTPVLVVDDSLYVHYSIAPVLADRGLKIVDFAFSGVEAFNLYQIFNPALVIMDISMPVKSGIETAKDIYKENPAAKILFVTALGEYKPLVENIKQMFHGKRYLLITKPIRPIKLLAAVNDLLAD